VGYYPEWNHKFIIEVAKRGFSSNQILAVSCIREGNLKDELIGETGMEI
jgi:hypothetical protein